jgi:hypothetical protein
MPRKKKRNKSKASEEVGQTSSAYCAMSSHWELIDALDGGTLAMRDASETYLPRETKEGTDAYEARLSRSVLFNGYRDTSRKISARPFSRPVSLKGDDELSDVLRSIEEDTDGEGTGLTQLGRELFRDALNRGVVHVVVDYPVLNGDETKEQERAVGARPVFIPVSASNVIGWRSASVNGKTRLTQVRIRESGEENVGDYGTQTVDRIRVWNEATWEVWRQREAKVDKWVKESEGEHTFGGVPMFTAYFEHTGFMTAVPPLEDLAWLNLAHWQSSSDQRNILRFARTGLWFVKGISLKEFKKQGGLKLGPSQYTALESTDADIKVVEHSGSAIEMGANDLRALEEKMEIMGLQPFVRLSGYQTATGTAIHEGRNQTEIQAWVRSIERLLEEAYWGAAHWIGEEALVEDLKVDIFSDFGIGPRIAADVEALIKARTAREIPRDVFLRELRKRGVLSEDESIEEMEESLEAEGPALSEMGGGGFEENSEGEE